jgi:hypothetical protein
VVLDAQQDAPTVRPRKTPDVERVDDVADVEVPGRGRREARDHRHSDRFGYREAGRERFPGRRADCGTPS